jgi:hypothetical protein
MMLSILKTHGQLDDQLTTLLACYSSKARGSGNAYHIHSVARRSFRIDYKVFFIFTFMLIQVNTKK